MHVHRNLCYCLKVCCSQLRVPAALFLGKQPLVCIEQEAEWVSELV